MGPWYWGALLFLTRDPYDQDVRVTIAYPRSPVPYSLLLSSEAHWCLGRATGGFRVLGFRGLGVRDEGLRA